MCEKECHYKFTNPYITVIWRIRKKRENIKWQAMKFSGKYSLYVLHTILIHTRMYVCVFGDEACACASKVTQPHYSKDHKKKNNYAQQQ